MTPDPSDTPADCSHRLTPSPPLEGGLLISRPQPAGGAPGNRRERRRRWSAGEGRRNPPMAKPCGEPVEPRGPGEMGYAS